jgi:hypothetical protein
MYFVDRSDWQRVVELTRAIQQVSEKWNGVMDRYRFKISMETPCHVPVELYIQEHEDQVDNQLRLVLEGDADYIYARDQIYKWKQERKKLVEMIMYSESG